MSKIKNKKKIAKLLTTTMAFAMAAAIGFSANGTVTLKAAAGNVGERYYNGYSSMTEAEAAADELNKQISEEGMVLLKNDGTLPLHGNEFVSVFGSASASLVGTTGGSVEESLRAEGFNVNPTLEKFYETAGGGGSGNGNGGASVSKEPLNFSKAAENSMNLYSDAAIVVFSRSGHESSDNDTVINEQEDEKYGTQEKDWTHKESPIGSYVKQSNTSMDAGGGTTTEQLMFKYDNKSADSKKYKHGQQLTDSEEELLEYVKARYDKVVVVLNTSNAMEMRDLEQDEDINAILLAHRMGETGYLAIGEILSGTVNPSGKLVDEWMTDFTADPTWRNFGLAYQSGGENVYYYPANSTFNATDEPVASGNWPCIGNQMYNTGYYGVDYEEDIYLGYKYYETYYQEYYKALVDGGKTQAEAALIANDWWEKAVVYSFGSGLSYTDFAFNIEDDDIYATGNNGVVKNFNLKTSNLETLFASAVDSPATVKTIHIPVTVTNTGDIAGKEVVEIYVSAPYTSGEVEKSSVTLVGYAKTTMLKPGQSQTVDVSFNVQDAASFDYKDANKNGNFGYELDAGEYTIRVMNTAHYDVATDVNDTNDAYDEVSFSLNNDVFLKLDDFSDNLSEPVFSDKWYDKNYDASKIDANGKVYGMYNTSVRTSDWTEDGSEMSLLSRKDFGASNGDTHAIASYPVASTVGDRTLKEVVYDNWALWNSFGYNEQINDPETGRAPTADHRELDASAEWADEVDIPDSWTQGTGVVGADGTYATKLSDMLGINPYASEAEAKQWETFMNQLTYEELVTITETGGGTTSSVPTIGKNSGSEADSPLNLKQTHQWGCAVSMASTWNVELAEKMGIIVGEMAQLQDVVGWWGPAMNTHRTPFSGRNNEYYSQDGIQGGYIAAAVVSGAESRGVSCYVKHFVLNDQETNRDGMNSLTWVSEQCIRENQAKVFQMAMQEGGSAGAMSGFARISGVVNAVGYDLNVNLAREEWGWEGVFITDGYMGVSLCTVGDFLLRCGTYILQLGANTTVSGEWDSTLRGGKGGVVVDVYDKTKQALVKGESDIQYYFVRSMAQRLLFETVNSFENENGLSTLKLTGSTIEAKQGEELKTNVAFSKEQLGESDAVYEIAGNLPDGIEFSSAGAFSGKALEAGSYSFTITAKIDGYITRSAAYTMIIKDGFTVQGDNLAEYKVGTEHRSALVSEVIEAGEGYSSISYTAEGLPAGLTMGEDGSISGTPTEAGTYDVRIIVSATPESSGGSGGPGGGPGGSGSGAAAEPEEYVVNVTITVAGEEITPVENLTAEQVQDMIDAALKAAESKDEENKSTESSGCGSAIGVSFAAVAVLIGAVVVEAKRKED